jgi:gliding motility-associated-like protein
MAIMSWHWMFGTAGLWIDSSYLQNPVYYFPDTGIYNVRIMIADLNACSDTLDSLVAINPSPVAAFTITDTVNGTKGKIRLNNLSTMTKYFSWNYGNGEGSDSEYNPVVQYDRDGVYTIQLIVKDMMGCADTTYTDYEFMFDNLFVPNAFSPTSVTPTVKGMEVRKFLPKGLNLQNYHVMVFDKWGHLIWESKKLTDDGKGMPAEGWDGTLNGEPMPQDVYMWKINATFKNGKVWEGSDTGKGSTTNMGTVTLIR